MFQAKGCPVWGSKDTNLTPLLNEIINEKIIVFNLMEKEVQAPNQVTLIKTSLALDTFSNGVDTIVEAIKGETEKTNCVFVAESTEEAVSGMVVAGVVKSTQTLAKMKDMIAEGITDKEWMDKLIHKSFEEESGSPMDKYDVVESLVSKLDNKGLGKLLADKIVDLCEEKVNLRNSIKALKDKYDSNGEQEDTKTATLQALERYFNAVCVGVYARTVGDAGYSTKFSQWVKENNFIEASIRDGIRFWQDMTFFSLAPSAACTPA